MTDLFSSSKLMMCRARHHIGDLANQINAFMDGKPWTHLVENNVDGTKNLHKIKFTKRLPEDTSCIVFDAANNIRSVLDQMAFAIAVKHTGIIKPKSAKFPFGPTEFDMLNNSKGARNDLPPEISSLFESFRPYKGGNNLLWALNELANTPKHQTIVPVGIGGATASFLPPGIIRGELVIQPPSWDPINNEIIFLTSDRGWQFTHDANITFTVVLEDIDDVIGRQNPVRLLSLMASEVEQVFNRTETTCITIGLF